VLGLSDSYGRSAELEHEGDADTLLQLINAIRQCLIKMSRNVFSSSAAEELSYAESASLNYHSVNPQ